MLEVGAYAEVNGIRLYYEVHGRPDGTPLVLLHGGGSTIDVTLAGSDLACLASSRDCRRGGGHGRRSDRDAPVSFENSADDVAALLEPPEGQARGSVWISNGASVALEVAIRHPEGCASSSSLRR